MRFVNEEKTFHEQTTTPAFDPATLSGPIVESRPSWPPPPRLRPRQGPPWLLRVLIIALAALLVLGGLGLLVYSTTNQYSRALGERNTSDLTATVRGKISSQATTAAHQRATVVPLETANAKVYATVTAQAQPAATASAIVAQGTQTTQIMAALLSRATSGTPALNDPLSDNSQGHVWDVGYADNNNTGCNFVSGSYQVLEAETSGFLTCFADATSFSNFVYQAAVTMNTSSAAGLVLRGNNNTHQYYLFTINVDGTYRLELYNNNAYYLLTSGTSTAIQGGVGKQNTLAIIADQGVFDLFVNQTFVGEAISGQLKAGQIGVVVYNTGVPASADFSNAEVWKV